MIVDKYSLRGSGWKGQRSGEGRQCVCMRILLMWYMVRHEDLVSYHNATIDLAEKFRNFYIDHVPRQQNTHADALAPLAALLALLAGVAEKILVYSHDLYCPRFAFEDHQKLTGDRQVKEALETSTGPEL